MGSTGWPTTTAAGTPSHRPTRSPRSASVVTRPVSNTLCGRCRCTTLTWTSRPRARVLRPWPRTDCFWMSSRTCGRRPRRRSGDHTALSAWPKGSCRRSARAHQMPGCACSRIHVRPGWRRFDPRSGSRLSTLSPGSTTGRTSTTTRPTGRTSPAWSWPARPRLARPGGSLSYPRCPVFRRPVPSRLTC